MDLYRVSNVGADVAKVQNNTERNFPSQKVITKGSNKRFVGLPIIRKIGTIRSILLRFRTTPDSCAAVYFKRVKHLRCLRIRNSLWQRSA